MNRFTKSSIATALQVMAIIILFGYPGCSANTTSGQVSPKASVVKQNKVDLNANFGKFGESYISKLLQQQKAK